MMTIVERVGPTQPMTSKQSSNLSMKMPKWVGDRGQPCLNFILQLIYFDQPLVILNLEIMFSYNLTTIFLIRDETFRSPNPF